MNARTLLRTTILLLAATTAIRAFPVADSIARPLSPTDSASGTVGPDSLRTDSVSSLESASDSIPVVDGDSLPPKVDPPIDTIRRDPGERAAGATVTIRASRHRSKEISKQTMTRADYGKVVATAQDPLRSLPTLPGVSTASDLSVRPIVRGGDEAETAVELDGVPLIMPYHFGSTFSVFHREDLEDFQFYSGVAPASADGALSGTVLARSRSAPFDSLSGGVDLSLLRGSAWLGFPIVKDRAALWISGQAFLYDFTLKRAMELSALVGAADEDEVERYKATTSLPTNWDAQAGTSILLTPGLVLDVGGFVAGDSYRVRGTRTICLENGREVPCPEVQVRHPWDPVTGTSAEVDTVCVYRNDDWTQIVERPCPDRFERREGFDTSAIVDLTNRFAISRLRWTPTSSLSVEAIAAYQTVDWDVEFPGDIAHELEDSASNRWRTTHHGDSSVFDWRRNAFDLRLSSRVRWDEAHETSLGIGWSQGHEAVETNLNRSLANLILGTSGNPLDFLGFYNDERIFETRAEEALDLDVGNLEQLDFDLNSDRAATRQQFWFEHRWDVDEKTRVRAGLRFPVQDERADVPNPRLHLQRQIGDADLVGFGLALHTQSELPFQWRLAATSPLESEKVWIGVAEWEHTFAPGWRTTLTGWGKIYRDLASPSLERYGDPDSTQMENAVNDWLYRYQEINGLSDLFRQLQEGYEKAPRWSDTVVDYEEFNRVSQRYRDSLTTWFDSSKATLVSPELRSNLERWLTPRRLGYASTGEGWAAGAEASLRYRPTPSWTGWASAELSISRRRDRPDGTWYPFGSERPWKLSWVNAFEIERGWELSLRYMAMAGTPYTPFRFGERTDSVSLNDTVVWIGERNSARMAPYQRFDLRLSRSSTVFGFPATWYYEVWNAFNDPNMILRDSETGEFRWISMNIPIPVVFLGCEVRF